MTSKDSYIASSTALCAFIVLMCLYGFAIDEIDKGLIILLAISGTLTVWGIYLLYVSVVKDNHE